MCLQKVKRKMKSARLKEELEALRQQSAQPPLAAVSCRGGQHARFQVEAIIADLTSRTPVIRAAHSTQQVCS